MGVSLSKGGNVSLSKEAPGLTNITIGLGWDVNTFSGGEFDLDASALMCGADGKVLSDSHFIFYNQATSPDGSVKYGGDNKTGEGDGDDETIAVDLPSVPPECEKLVVSVSIYEHDKRSQNFGDVRNAFIRVVNDADGTEIARYDLSEDAAGNGAMVFGEVYRDKSSAGDWKFKAVGAGYQSGLKGIAEDFGVNV